VQREKILQKQDPPMFNVIAFPHPFTLWVFSWWGVTIPHTLAYIIGLQKNLFVSPCVFSKRKRHPIT